MTADPEVVLEAGVEGGGVRLYRLPTATGGWEFFTEINETAQYDLLVDADGPPDDEPVRRSKRVATLEEGLALLDAAPWPRFHAIQVHPEYATQVLAQVEAQLRGLPVPEEKYEHVLARWRRSCGGVKDGE